MCLATPSALLQIHNVHISALQWRMKTEVARADGPQPETVRVMVCNELICPNLAEQIRSVRFRGTMWCLSVCTPGAGRSVRLRDKAVWNSHTHLYAPVSAFESAERGGGFKRRNIRYMWMVSSSWTPPIHELVIRSLWGYFEISIDVKNYVMGNNRCCMETSERWRNCTSAPLHNKVHTQL